MIVEHHMRVHFLADAQQTAAVRQRRAHDGAKVLRAARFTGILKIPATPGIDICLLSLADLRGTYEITLPQDAWEAELETAARCSRPIGRKHEEVVSPPRYPVRR